MNEVIREVMELTRSETEKNGTSAQAAFWEGLPLIEGDAYNCNKLSSIS